MVHPETVVDLTTSPLGGLRTGDNASMESNLVGAVVVTLDGIDLRVAVGFPLSPAGVAVRGIFPDNELALLAGLDTGKGPNGTIQRDGLGATVDPQNLCRARHGKPLRPHAHPPSAG